MLRVALYSGLLLLGMIVSQAANLTPLHLPLHLITMLCLSYIMIEVGLEFSADMKHPSAYATDSLIALTASIFPWIFCAAYFVWAFRTGWHEALFVACFAAPTSAGVLFTLLAAAGLETTWVFQKARVLAIFDDLSTVLLLIALQILFVGWQWQLLIVVVISLGLLYLGYRRLNRSSWPVGKPWLLLYSALIAGICWGFGRITGVHIEVLLPAFVLGCILRHHSVELGDDPHSSIDQIVKATFMFLVGCSLPAISMGTMSWGKALMHVLALTLVSNLGKCFPLLCYRKEATVRERTALSVAMFPRGEVGAGVLLMSLGYGITGLPLILSSLSLGLNLLCTGAFIFFVKKLLVRRGE